MPTNDLNKLRAEAIRKRKAASAKIARLRNSKGVEITGTEYDPRKPADVLRRYNRRQLVNYLANLAKFTDRQTSFVNSAFNKPISAEAWNRYKELESRYNAIGAERDAKVADLRVPNTGMTVKEMDRMFTPNSKVAQGDLVNRPYGQINRSPENVNGAEALDRLTQDLKNKLKGTYLPEQIAIGRKQLKGMLDEIGNSEFTKRFNKLTDAQFDVMWNYGNAREIASFYSVLQMHISASGKEAYIEEHGDDIRSILEWAESLPANGPKTVRKGK